MDILKDTVVRALHGEVESDCANALREIRCILADDALDDAECFERIEGIVRIYEKLGIDCGNRHNFG